MPVKVVPYDDVECEQACFEANNGNPRYFWDLWNIRLRVPQHTAFFGIRSTKLMYYPHASAGQKFKFLKRI